jgi:hypothetical protein
LKDPAGQVHQKERIKPLIDEFISAESDEKNKKKYRKMLDGEERANSEAHP